MLRHDMSPIPARNLPIPLPIASLPPNAPSDAAILKIRNEYECFFSPRYVLDGFTPWAACPGRLERLNNLPKLPSDARWA